MSLLVIPENKLGILSTMKSKTKVFVDVSYFQEIVSSEVFEWEDNRT